MNPDKFQENFNFEQNYWWFVGRRKIIETLIQKYFQSTKDNAILDVGCGTGLFLDTLKKYGKPIGVDCSSLAIDYTILRGTKIVACGDICNLPFKNESFDLITILGVLYHRRVQDEALAIQEIFRILKKGGLMIIDEAAYNFLQSKHNLNVDGKRRFHRSELVRQCEIKKFKIIKSSYWNSFMLPIFTLLVFIEKFLPVGQAGKLFKIPSFFNMTFTMYLSIEAFLLKYINFPFGPSVVIVAKKQCRS